MYLSQLFGDNIATNAGHLSASAVSASTSIRASGVDPGSTLAEFDLMLTDPLTGAVLVQISATGLRIEP